MFCKKCGQEISENVKFCPKCGESTGNVVVQSNVTVVDTEDKDKKTYRAVGIAVVAICVIVLLNLMSGKGYEKVVRNYYKSVQNSNVNLYYSLLVPDYVDYMVGPGSWYSSKEVFKESLKKDLENEYDDYSHICGNNLRFSAKITDSERFTAKEISSLTRMLKQDYDFTHSISDIRKVYYTLTVWGNDDITKKDMSIYVIKVGGKWYLQRGYIGESWQD